MNMNNPHKGTTWDEISDSFHFPLTRKETHERARIIGRLIELRYEQSLSQNSLGRLVKKDPSILSNIEKGKYQTPHFLTLVNFFYGLGYKFKVVPYKGNIPCDIKEYLHSESQKLSLKAEQRRQRIERLKQYKASNNIWFKRFQSDLFPEILKEIFTICEEQSINKNSQFLMSGISGYEISKLKKGKDIYISTIMKLVDVLGYKLEITTK